MKPLFADVHLTARSTHLRRVDQMTPPCEAIRFSDGQGEVVGDPQFAKPTRWSLLVKLAQWTLREGLRI